MSRVSDIYESARFTDRWTRQIHMDSRRKNISRRGTKKKKKKHQQRFMRGKKEAHKQSERQTVCHSVTQTSERRMSREWHQSLTFLLPSVTVRGTGMGGHLLRLGGGFSLFQRMMI